MSNIDVRKLQLFQLEVFKEVDRICRSNNIKYFMIGGTLLGAVRHKGFIPWDIDVDIAMFRDDYNRFTECCKSNLTDKYFLQNYQTDIDYFPSLTHICMNNTFTELAHSNHLQYHKGIHIDIFPLDNVANNEKERNKQKKLLAFIDRIKIMKASYIYDSGLFGCKVIIKRSLRSLMAPIPLKWLNSIREKIMTEHANKETKFVCSTASHYGYDKQVMEREIYGTPILLEFEDAMYFAPQKWDEYLTRIYGDYMTPPPIEKRIEMKDYFSKVIFDCQLDKKAAISN